MTLMCPTNADKGDHIHDLRRLTYKCKSTEVIENSIVAIVVINSIKKTAKVLELV